jgi:site-specific recombinase XerD
MRQTDLAKTLTHFLSQYLPGQRNVSTNTIKSYRDTFKQLLTFCDSKCISAPEYLTLGKIKAEIIQGFLAWLEKSKGISITIHAISVWRLFTVFTGMPRQKIQRLCLNVIGILSIPFKSVKSKPLIISAAG